MTSQRELALCLKKKLLYHMLRFTQKSEITHMHTPTNLNVIFSISDFVSELF